MLPQRGRSKDITGISLIKIGTFVRAWTRTPQPSMPQNEISELVEHFRLDAHYQDHELVISYPDRRRRNVKRVEKWTRKDSVGQGTFGLIWLFQKFGENTGEVRAVKQIRKGMSCRQTLRSDCAHELYAMSKLTRASPLVIFFGLSRLIFH